jgi:hypothetical protein
MKVVLGNHILTATREEGDPKIYSESLLLHGIKKELIKQGHDVIKKRMWKDGHLYGDDKLQYIRSRNKGKKFQNSHDFIMVYDGNYAIRAMEKEYNEGELTLLVERGDD